jgi:hypothetical protein
MLRAKYIACLVPPYTQYLHCGNCWYVMAAVLCFCTSDRDVSHYWRNDVVDWLEAVGRTARVAYDGAAYQLRHYMIRIFLGFHLPGRKDIAACENALPRDPR